MKPITVLITALGGEGGGVLAEWLVDTALRCGHSVQSTSIPGVAQRTGATTYYVEVFPVPDAALGGRRPVFSLTPVPGALDLLLSSELLETARQVGNETVFGLALLRVLAAMRRLRRHGSRFAAEQAAIERWLAAVEAGARRDAALGFELAACGRLVKGYGATNARGKANLMHVIDHLAAAPHLASDVDRAEAIRQARTAALADEAGPRRSAVERQGNLSARRRSAPVRNAAGREDQHRFGGQVPIRLCRSNRQSSARPRRDGAHHKTRRPWLTHPTPTRARFWHTVPHASASRSPR